MDSSAAWALSGKAITVHRTELFLNEAVWAVKRLGEWDAKSGEDR